jgi:predicted RND superfamily exporter protein
MEANVVLSAAVVDGFESPTLDERWIVRVGAFIFKWRRLLLIVGMLITAVMGWSATHLRVTAGFTKMIPLHHPFMQTFLHYQGDFGGADKVLIAIKVRQGDIFTKKTLDTVRKITDETFYIKGIERSSLTSMVTPNVRWNEVVEEGFKGGPLMSADFAGTPEQLEKVRQNLSKSDWVGRIVSNDISTTLVAATLQDRDPDTGERLDLRRVGAQLEDIRAKYEDQDLSLHIVGFAKASADIAGGAMDVVKYFLIAFAITAAMLFWYSRSAMLTGWVLLAASIPVVWLMGALPLLGLGLDPMSILVPFLIFAIGVSHAVQMTNAWKLETLRGADGVTASHNCFVNLFIPGATALLANAVGFIVIAIVDIEIVRELALTATIGVSVMIVTNKVLLPILLSYMRLSSASAQRLHGKETAGNWLWSRMGFLATRRGSLIPLAIGLALTAFGIVEVRGLKIGDLGTGVPELRADTRYNRDVATITSQFAIGLDVLQVIAEMEGADSPCLKRELLAKVENFETGLRQVEGVAAVRGLASFIGAVTQDYAEGWVKWRVLPETKEQIAQATGFASRLGNEYRNTQCNAIPLSIYPTDHQATTIKRIVAAIEDFKKRNDGGGITFRLASGNVGVMAATNEVVEQSDKWVNFALFAAVSALCLVTFRSLRITLCVILPLALVTLLCNAIMATLLIGVKVNTLPVIAISVGVGVDYGIYLFESMRHRMSHGGASLQAAFVEALKERGTASIFTAAMMTISVLTWAFSTLKFQADMGILLAFMFMVNVFGAIFLLPGLAAWVVGGRGRVEA